MQDALDQHAEEIQDLKARLEEERKEREDGLTRERDLEKIVEEVRRVTSLRGRGS